MGNSFVNILKEATNYTLTENGGLAHRTTNNAVYDMFATSAAYRKRSDEDCILLFKNAFEENPLLALKCLFWTRDCRGGAGERRYFKVVLKWLANEHPEVVRANMELIPEYGRYDDLFVLVGTKVETDMVQFVQSLLALDLTCKTPSLLAKWLPSENASAIETKKMGRFFRKNLHLTSKEYRKTLSYLRDKINIVETLMSEDRWEEIEFDKIPSKAGLKYKNAFARRDIIAKRYEDFIKSNSTKVNANTLYPYEIVDKALHCDLSEVDRKAIEKYWDNLPDYINNAKANLMCVVDTSGSMTWSAGSAKPINVAISLGMYCAERLRGPFHNRYISFASRPQLIKIEGIDFVDKVKRIYRTNLCDSTDLEAVFDLLYKTAMTPGVKKEDIPTTIIVLSDMEINQATTYSWDHTHDKVKTMMETQREKWERSGLPFPKLVYWNIESRNRNAFLDDGPDVTYVSGASPTIFKAVLSGKTGTDLMLEVLNGDRYNNITLS